MAPPSSVGDRIRAAREALGLTRGALAAQIRRTEEAVAFYEDGTLVPSSHVLALFAHALGVPLAGLVSDEVRAVDAGIAQTMGEGPIVPQGRRAALITLFSVRAAHVE